MGLQVLLLATVLTCAASAPNDPTYRVDNDDSPVQALEMSIDLDAERAPPYTESLLLIARNGKALVDMLPQERLPVTDPRRHYILIAGVLAGVVEYLNSDCTPADYEHEYLPVVDILLPIIWQDPSVAVVKLENFIELSNDTIQVVQELVDLHCTGLQPTVCDLVVQAIASTTDEYKDALNLLLLIGDLARIYEKNRYIDEATAYLSVPLLLNGQKTMKRLVFKGAEVYNALYGVHCEP